MNRFSIVPWREEYRQSFVDLSVKWLNSYDLLEPADFILLNDPHGQALDVGGAVFFAQSNGAAVGTVAMVPDGPDSFELAKLTVDESYRRCGIGRALVQRAIDFAREKKAGRIVLYSNRKLQPAIALYTELGFREVPHENSKYEVSDVKMTLDLI